MKQTKGEKIYAVFNYIILAVVGIVTVFPFYITLINSISPALDFALKPINLWPSQVDISSYRVLLGKNTGILNAYSVTLFVTIVGTALNMLFTVLAAVALSNKDLPYRNAITMFFVFTMYFGGGMIPAYLLNNYLGLLNNIWVMIIPGLVSAMNMLYLRNFISQIPHEIIESASIDGCSDVKMVPYIILPLSTAAIATFSLFYAVGHWNDFSSCALYITDPNKYNLQVYLMNILKDARTMRLNPDEMAKLYEIGAKQPPTESLKAANIMAATLPIVCVYPFLQRFFVKGLVVGSLKG